MNNNIGFVGAGSDKFNEKQERTARLLIDKIAFEASGKKGIPPTLVSGHSKMIGIDIWAEQAWDKLGLGDFKDIQAPDTEDWEDFLCCSGCRNVHQGQINRYHKCECTCHSPVLRDAELNWVTLVGYKTRNLAIAKKSKTVHVILSTVYPSEYKGQRFGICYHCEGKSSPWKNKHPWHVKSGACFTALRAYEMGNNVVFYFVSPDGEYIKVAH